MDEEKDPPKEVSAAQAGGAPPVQPAAQPPIQPPRGPEPIHPDGDEDCDQRPEKMSTSDRVMMWATIVIAAGTLVSAAAIALQWREMVGGGADTTKIANAADQIKVYAGNVKDSAQQSATAAGTFSIAASGIDTKIGLAEKDFAKMAQNSEGTIKATQDQMRLDERAWVGAVNPSGTINAKDPLKVEARIVILGKSPAVAIVSQDGMIYAPVGHVLQFSELVLNPKKFLNGTAFPGSSFPIREAGTGDSHEKEVTQAVLDKRTNLYFFGEITYRDIFRVHHWTHFCFVIPSSDLNDWAPCDIYNDSDADGKSE